MQKLRGWLTGFRFFQRREGTAHILAWAGIQLFALLGFLGYLGFLDAWLRERLSTDQDTLIQGLVSRVLDQGLWFFLPDGFWFLVLPLLLMTLALLLFTSWRWWFLGTACFLVTLLTIGDRIYHQFFDSIIPISSMGATGQLWKVRSSIFSSFHWVDLLLLVFCLVFPIFGWAMNLGVSSKLGQNKLFFLVDKFLGIAFLVLTFHAATLAFYLPNKHVVIENEYSLKVYNDRSEAQGMNFTVPYQSSYRSFAATFGVFNFHLYNLAETFQAAMEDDRLPEDMLGQVEAFLGAQKERNDLPSELGGIAKGRNVIVISLESFASALIGLEVKGKEVTPSLNRLAKTQLFWPTIVDNARTGGTSDAEFSVLTGLMTDLRRMAAMGIAEQADLLALPRSLKEMGYATYSFHGNEASFWNRNVNHPRLGIDTLKFEASYPDDVSLGIGIPDHVVFPMVWDILAQGGSPFFGFVISLSSHHPFPDIPDTYHGLDLSDLPDTPFSRYLKLANYTDRSLGDFIDAAKAKGLWEDSMLILYGDHRPPLDDSDLGRFSALSGVSLEKGRGLQIPVVIALPGLEDQLAPFQGQALDTVGGLQDIYPTILHLLGQPVPFGIYGTHLLVPNAQRAPMPMFKLSSSYVYNGVVYSGPLGNPVADELGLLFIKRRDTLISDSARKQALFKQAAKALEMHLYIFNQNAQKDAIELHRNHGNASN